MCRNNFCKQGFTLVEMAIVIPIVTLVVIVLISTSINLINRASEANTITRRSADIQSALDTIEQDISYGIGFASKVKCDKQWIWHCGGIERKITGPGPHDWNYELMGMIRPDGTKAFLIKTLITDRNPLSGDPNIKLIHRSEPNATCSLNPPATGYAIYYFFNGNLMRKFASNEAPSYDSNKFPCGEPWQRKSCSDYPCPEQDKIILKDAEVEVNFFSDSAPNEPLANLYNPALTDDERQEILNKATTIEVVLKSKVVGIKGDKPTIVSGRLRANRIQ